MEPEKDKEIHEKMGEILTKSLSVENRLELFIARYFINPSDERSLFFDDIIIQQLNFSSKIEIFKKICNREKFPPNDIKDIIHLINEIKDIRNEVAHSETILNISTERKHLVRRTMSSRPSIDLNKEFMEGFSKKINWTLNLITQFCLRISY
ncbi:MAG: hypothetical protein RL557_343 [archaeon]|jgi:hypothetical protein